MTIAKLLVIGLDGATFDLLKPWAESGHLPNFAKLLNSGSHGSLRSVPNTDTAPAWTTFATGLNPANHGIFHELNWSPKQMMLQQVHTALDNAPPFWQIASDAGRRVAVLNVPFSYPARPANGCVVAGYGSPSKSAPDFCHPDSLLTEIEREVGTYHIDSPIQLAIHENRPKQGIRDSHHVAQKRTDTFLYMLEQADWELGVVVYNLPDVVQHFFWQQMVQGVGEQASAIREGYIWIDREIGRLLDHVGTNTNILIMSDHGFGPICNTPQHLSDWLTQQGFTSKLPTNRLSWQRRLTQLFQSWLRRYLGEAAKAFLRSRLPNLRNKFESDVRFANIDWANTIAYAGPSPYEIWINSQKREPHGIVASGVAYEEACQAIITALLAWQDPITHEKRVKRVYRRDEVYQGTHQHLAPDLTIEWNPTAAPAAHTLPDNHSKFDADHQPEGILILSGPDIASRQTIHDASLADLAPTILRLLQISHRKTFDGRVLDVFGV